jgi:RNA polymerase sigma factor (TIGR02999 family)
MSSSPTDVTTLLRDWGQGDASALEKLIPLVFRDLREIAGRLFRRENDGHTLQPTALVNEVFIRLTEQRKACWANREQFFGVAAMMMRRILVDYAKGKQAAKRGSGAIKLPLDEALGLAAFQKDVDVVALDDALTRLAQIDERQSRIVDLHYFVGLTYEEIAEVLGVSVTTVKREWHTAKLWLYRELKK